MSTDAELLRRYVEHREERAFAELVYRHLGMVYAAALRRTGGRIYLAEEIAQKVFIDLVRKSAGLVQHPVLTGWLYRSTRYAAIDALRADARRQQFTRTLAEMPEMNPTPEDSIEWEKLRPVIDAVLDDLKESDREAILLRYFERLSFVEISARLALSENTVRMRTDRALGKLRHLLEQRGVTSTVVALELLLVNEAFATAPGSLVANITSNALVTMPSGIFATILMNKITATALGSLLAVGLTSVAWTTFAQGVNQQELIELRAENTRLSRAMAPGSSDATIAAVADEFSARASQITQIVGQRLARKGTGSAGKHSNHGQTSPHDAFLSHAWASDTGDVQALTRLLCYDEKGRASIRDIFAGMPEVIRAQYRTPEELIAFFFIADTLLSPVPGADVLEPYTVHELQPGRVVLRRPGAHGGGMEFVQTADGWKNEVPSYYPKILASRILGSEMLSNLNSR